MDNYDQIKEELEEDPSALGHMIKASVLRAVMAEVEQLKAAIGTPEVYAGVITKVLEEELERAKKERNDAIAAALVYQKGD